METIIPSHIPRRYDLALRQEEFKSGPAQGSLDPVSEVHAVFSNRHLPSTSEEVNPKQQQTISSMGGCSLTLGGSTKNSYEKKVL